MAKFVLIGNALMPLRPPPLQNGLLPVQPQPLKLQQLLPPQLHTQLQRLLSHILRVIQEWPDLAVPLLQQTLRFSMETLDLSLGMLTHAIDIHKDTKHSELE